VTLFLTLEDAVPESTVYQAGSLSGARVIRRVNFI